MSRHPELAKTDATDHQTQAFTTPVKHIHDGADVTFFLTSTAYRDIITFVLQLNRSVIPRKVEIDGKQTYQTWPLAANRPISSPSILGLRKLLTALDAIISEAPPDPGPRRFGNVSFRTWSRLVQERIRSIFTETFSPDILRAADELEAYLTGSFGSPQRLDYGTGHELSFLAFLGCLWKLNYFETTDPGVVERSIVLDVFEPYLTLIRRLIQTYNLEPAGSHGVWGLDDNSFLPYIFGSAQLAPAIDETDDIPTEGSIPNGPDPAAVVTQTLVDKSKDNNMYFSAISFIYDVKRGPFWEHSPMLFDISGVKDGWGKINKGMLKMYNVEVLSKFPVVQHFPFGASFKWERDPEATPPPVSTHAASQPLRSPVDSNAPTTVRPGAPGMAMPGIGRVPPPPAPRGFVRGVTRAPWAGRGSAPPPPPSFPRTALNSARLPPRPRPVADSMDASKISPDKA